MEIIAKRVEFFPSHYTAELTFFLGSRASLLARLCKRVRGRTPQPAPNVTLIRNLNPQAY
jgi:hypothetical protein